MTSANGDRRAGEAEQGDRRGDPAALVKGLRTLINEQKNIMDQAEAEDRYVAVFVTNREAEFGLFKKRRDAMQARAAELNRFMDEHKKP